MAHKNGCKSSGSKLTDEQRAILEALANTQEPIATKDIAKATGLKSNAISCRLRSLKSKGFVESPARCKYTITADGKQILATG